LVPELLPPAAERLTGRKEGMTDQSSAEVSKPLKWDSTMKFKAAAAIVLGVSVLTLELLGKAPSGTYLALIVGPGLAAIGLHKS
jgi:hypothetical protein